MTGDLNNTSNKEDELGPNGSKAGNQGMQQGENNTSLWNESGYDDDPRSPAFVMMHTEDNDLYTRVSNRFG